jgi:hypothetical protein
MGRGTWGARMAGTWDLGRATWGAMCGRQSTPRRATRREQPINKSNILSEQGQHYLPSWGKERTFIANNDVFSPWHDGGEGTRRHTSWSTFLRASWPSILLRQGYGGQGRSALPSDFPRGTGAAKGLAALPDVCDVFPSGHDGGEGACRPTSWSAFLRAPWPSILLRQGYGGQGRSALPSDFPPGTTAAKGLAALPVGNEPSRCLPITIVKRLPTKVYNSLNYLFQ